MFIAKTSITVA